MASWASEDEREKRGGKAQENPGTGGNGRTESEHLKKKGEPERTQQQQKGLGNRKRMPSKESSERGTIAGVTWCCKTSKDAAIGDNSPRNQQPGGE